MLTHNMEGFLRVGDPQNHSLKDEIDLIKWMIWGPLKPPNINGTNEPIMDHY
jgi:hypothetical protein